MRCIKLLKYDTHSVQLHCLVDMRATPFGSQDSYTALLILSLQSYTASLLNSHRSGQLHSLVVNSTR